MGSVNYNFSSSYRAKYKFSATPASTVSLIASNLITIGVAIAQNWNLADVMWVYWLQSIIIGFFQQKKMRELKSYSTDRFLINNKPVEPNEKNKHMVANFFILHYGLFHFVYFTFLLTQGPPDLKWLTFLGAVFFVNHYFSYRENRELDSLKVPNIGSMMFAPYIRIIPMHLTLIFDKASGSQASLVLFLLLKSLADVLMHNVEHTSRAE